MSRLEQLAVADIAPSPLNPRKHFDDAEIEELAASLRQDGVLQPLVVRPRGGALPEEIPDGPEPYFNRMAAAVGRAAASFELVAGERRWRAAQRAGLESVPAVVRTDLDDLAVLRLMIVENVQRSSLRPIEEATACRALLDADAGADVAAVADLVGRSASWVHQRVQLLKLTAGCLASVEAGRVSAGHAVEIARLEPADQDLALAECDFEGRDVPSWKEPASVRGLKRWIRDHIPLTRRDPAAAHRGVPVTLSPYLDNHNGTLTPAERKRILRADAFRVVKDGTAACAVAAVVVLGERAGEALRICPRRSKCETHWGEHFREQARRRKEEERWKQERRESDAGAPAGRAGARALQARDLAAHRARDARDAVRPADRDAGGPADRGRAALPARHRRPRHREGDHAGQLVRVAAACGHRRRVEPRRHP